MDKRPHVPLCENRAGDSLKLAHYLDIRLGIQVYKEVTRYFLLFLNSRRYLFCYFQKSKLEI
ncbi:Uncharacterised protein [Listeria grayi]|uniref:Uncharacterized protein n=1 Tax=Listeria grayi TaxID=1641 RepID=A0A378MCP3_LISGR|nr:Uncharacterised protein [Listeria grayi]